MTEDQYLNAVQAAEYLGVERQRIYQLAKEGVIGRKIAGYLVFTREELDRYRNQPKDKGGRPKKDSAE
jgi:excisionase family DNA binding protein